MDSPAGVHKLSCSPACGVLVSGPGTEPASSASHNGLLGKRTPAAAAAKSLQSCPTLRDPIDTSPPGSPAPGILQARTLEWVAISFSNAWKWKSESEVTQSCPTLSDPMDCSPPGSSIHGIFQARVLEWGATVFSERTPREVLILINVWTACIAFQVLSQTLSHLSYKTTGWGGYWKHQIWILQQQVVLRSLKLCSLDVRFAWMAIKGWPGSQTPLLGKMDGSHLPVLSSACFPELHPARHILVLGSPTNQEGGWCFQAGLKKGFSLGSWTQHGQSTNKATASSENPEWSCQFQGGEPCYAAPTGPNQAASPQTLALEGAGH